jgi:hypothetical protein
LESDPLEDEGGDEKITLKWVVVEWNIKMKGG